MTGGGILKATNNGLRQQSVARRAEIKVSCIGIFASNSKYVVCFKKLFAGKGGLYEFIVFYDMRA